MDLDAELPSILTSKQGKYSLSEKQDAELPSKITVLITQFSSNTSYKFEAVNGIHTFYTFEAANGVNVDASQPTVAKTFEGDKISEGARLLHPCLFSDATWPPSGT
jgi:hypothetical protein